MTASTGQSMSVSVTRSPWIEKPPRHHPVVRDELLEQFGDRRARPGDPAFGLEESALLLAGQQRLAVVQLAEEVDARLARS